MITVLFATRNGERTLPMMMDAFLELEVPEGGWEIIVVDNASTDATAAILKKYASPLPITYTHEGRIGKNHALNHGIEYARGDLIVFTDDDVIPQKDWLTQLKKCADGHPEYCVFTGSIHPFWLREPDAWIVRNVPLATAYAFRTKSMRDGEVSPYDVWGTNMAIRKKIFDQGFRYDPNVGPRGSDYAMGSEVSFARRLSQAGYRSWFCEKAVVRHIIREYQLDRKWLLGRAYRYGRGERRRPDRGGPAVPMVFWVPRWLIRKLLGQYWRCALSFFRGDKETYFRARWKINVIYGYMMESWIAKGAGSVSAKGR